MTLPAAEKCPLTLEEHLDWLCEALMEAGIGGDCENSYKSLVELAESFRLANHFDLHTPTLAQAMADDMLMDGLEDSIKH